MRKSFDSALWKENGEIVGINLGADFVSEHEWGIDGIDRLLGIDRSKMGIERYAVNQAPEIAFDDKAGAYTMSLEPDDFFGGKKITTPLLKRYKINTRMRSDDAAVCAWDSRNFLIHSDNEEVKNFLVKLKDAFSKKDVVVFVGRAGVFQNGGLSLVIKSKLPEKFKKDVLETHKEAKRLNNYFKQTKIEEKLNKAGKSFFALSPRWGREEELINSDYKIMCWLNPLDQSNYKYGWYTIEQLLEWIDDKGPIPYKNQTA